MEAKVTVAIMWRSVSLLWCCFIGGAGAFLPLARLRVPSLGGPVSLSNSEDNENSLDAMRRQLEASWNIATMGQVPTTAKSAAEAAAGALQSARERKSEASMFFVDVLLPQYDITQGKNLYDEVLAAEFCTELAGMLPGKSMILVKDAKTLRTINRVFQAREKNHNESNDNNEKIDNLTQDLQENIEIYDDFADVGMIGDATPVEVDDFRKKLISTWDSGEQEVAASVKLESTASPTKQKYRLASMLGDAKVSRGPDMADDVMEALASNAKAADDEDIVIILSAVDPEELIAVRALAASYKRKKLIVFVNSKLDPIPRELIGAQTVYSILPLLARSVNSESNIFGTSEQAATATPKVVVLLRYPRDWEVYIDVEGRGFELAASVPSDEVGSRGPSMEWIASSVKRHLQSRLG